MAEQIDGVIINGVTYDFPKATQINPSTPIEDGTYCDYHGEEFAVFNKCICIGDSLTAGTFNYSDDGIGFDGTFVNANYSFPKYITKIIGVQTTNASIGGAASWQVWDSKKNDNWSGHDCAIIQLGVNDRWRGSQSWGQQSIDAFTNIINKLKTENVGIKIFVATVDTSQRYYAGINQGIRDLVETLNDTDVVLIDLAEYGHIKTEDVYEKGHMTAFGYWRRAKDYIAIISYLMSMNKDLYKFVHFIGTQYLTPEM